jgi:hypothetical protein
VLSWDVSPEVDLRNRADANKVEAELLKINSGSASV